LTPSLRLFSHIQTPAQDSPLDLALPAYSSLSLPVAFVSAAPTSASTASSHQPSITSSSLFFFHHFPRLTVDVSRFFASLTSSYHVGSLLRRPSRLSASRERGRPRSATFWYVGNDYLFQTLLPRPVLNASLGPSAFHHLRLLTIEICPELNLPYTQFEEPLKVYCQLHNGTRRAPVEA
jgi:hypothetical protein